MAEGCDSTDGFRRWRNRRALVESFPTVPGASSNSNQVTSCSSESVPTGWLCGEELLPGVIQSIHTRSRRAYMRSVLRMQGVTEPAGTHPARRGCTMRSWCPGWPPSNPTAHVCTPLRWARRDRALFSIGRETVSRWRSCDHRYDVEKVSVGRGRLRRPWVHLLQIRPEVLIVGRGCYTSSHTQHHRCG